MRGIKMTGLSALYLAAALLLALPSNTVSVYLKAELKIPSSAEPKVEIWLDGRDAGKCELPEGTSQKVPPGAICSFQAKKGRHDVRVEIKVPGFKRFTHNVPSFVVGQDPSILDIGAIVLSASEIPKIEDIKVAQTLTGSPGYLVRVDLLNSSKKSFFVTEIVLSATSYRPLCDRMGPTYDYKLSDTLVVQTEGQDSRELAGTVVEKLNGKEYGLSATGEMVIAPCSGGDSLRIAIPAGFPLPSAEFVRVNLLFPQQFKVTHASGSQDRRRSQQSEAERVDIMRGFDSHEILMKTSDEDEPAIWSAFAEMPHHR
jgi:hypothetical protein